VKKQYIVDIKSVDVPKQLIDTDLASKIMNAYLDTGIMERSNEIWLNMPAKNGTEIWLKIARMPYSNVIHGTIHANAPAKMKGYSKKDDVLGFDTDDANQN
jgi:hypothetical protein